MRASVLSHHPRNPFTRRRPRWQPRAALRGGKLREKLFHETSQGQRATERIDPINSAQGSDIQDIVATASDGPHRPNQPCAADLICLEGTDPKDNAATALRRNGNRPQNRPKVSECYRCRPKWDWLPDQGSNLGPAD